MATITETKKKYTQEEYLELERKAEIKSEYYQGGNICYAWSNGKS
jgi:hypothetical protein